MQSHKKVEIFKILPTYSQTSPQHKIEALFQLIIWAQKELQLAMLDQQRQQIEQLSTSRVLTEP